MAKSNSNGGNNSAFLSLSDKSDSKSDGAASLLSVPSNGAVRRPSIESVFSGSDISELSFGSVELGGVHDEGLIRTLSNVSSTFTQIPGPSKWRTRLQVFWIANYGAFLVLSSQLFGSMMNTATRLLETPGAHGVPMHPFQILFVRQLITVLITVAYAVWSKSAPHFPFGPPGRVQWLLASRGFFGFLGVFGLYFSLLYLPLSEATILTFLTPIGTCYTFSLLIPGETFSRQQQLAGFVSLFGVILIARPDSLFNSSDPNPDTSHVGVNLSANSTSPAQGTDPSGPTSAQHLQAVGIAMIGVIGAVGAMTSIRAIGTQAHALVIVNYYSVLCTIISLLALIFVPSVDFRLPANSIEWGLLSIIGLCGFILQLLLTAGMAYGGASPTNKNRSDITIVDVEMQDREESRQRTGTPPLSRTGNAHPPPVPAEESIPSNKPIKGSGAKATSMLYTQILFALIADKLVFGVIPGLWSWIGSGFILFGAIWVATEGTKKTKSTGPYPESLQRHPVSGSAEGDSGREEEVGLLAGEETVEVETDEVQRDLFGLNQSRGGTGE